MSKHYKKTKLQKNKREKTERMLETRTIINYKKKKKTNTSCQRICNKKKIIILH